MPTLCVKNVPKELYEALRARARLRRRSIAAEVVTLLAENIPTQKDLKSRQAFLSNIRRLHAKKTVSSRLFFR
jgi:plasmid stability protein